MAGNGWGLLQVLTPEGVCVPAKERQETMLPTVERVLFVVLRVIEAARLYDNTLGSCEVCCLVYVAFKRLRACGQSGGGR